MVKSSMGPRLAVLGRLSKPLVGFSFLCGPALFLCASAFAGDFRLDINLASKHFVDTPGTLEEYNENNHGIGFEYRLNDKYHIMAGGYDNSINDQSYYAGVGRLLKTGATEYFWERYEFGAELGIANGYKDFVSEDGRHWEKSNDYSLIGGTYLRLGDIHALKFRYAISLATAGYQYQF